jgi:hypothetical protein
MKGLKKTVLAVCMAVVLGLGLVPVNALASETEQAVEITIDGEPFTQDSSTGFAVVKDGSPMVPWLLCRRVLESMGFKAELDWDADFDSRLITLTKADKKVYHVPGELVTYAGSPFDEDGTKEILAAGNVPSYDDTIDFTATIMVDLRLFLESFSSKGIYVEWQSSPDGTGTLAITVGLPPVGGDELIWLDENTPVNKPVLLYRLLKQNLDVFDVTPSLEDLIRILPIDETKVDRNYVFNTAKSYIEDLYNINYQTVTPAEVDAVVSKYYTERINKVLDRIDADWEAGFGDRVYDHISYEEVQKQQLIMETVFVSDESFMYSPPPAIPTKRAGTFSPITGTRGPNSSVRLRGTMFYKFTSNNNQGKYWNNVGSYVMGEWYWSDIALDFYEEINPIGEVVTVINASGFQYFDYTHGTINRSIDGRHLNLLSEMPEEPFVDHIANEAGIRDMLLVDVE